MEKCETDDREEAERSRSKRMPSRNVRMVRNMAGLVGKNGTFEMVTQEHRLTNGGEVWGH